MNIVVAMLVADFLRAEIIHGREKIPTLRAERRDTKRAMLREYGLIGTIRLLNEQDKAKISAIGEKHRLINDEIEFIEENAATLATLMVAIQHDNVDYMEAIMTKNAHRAE